jgi:hypothetical protein
LAKKREGLIKAKFRSAGILQNNQVVFNIARGKRVSKKNLSLTMIRALYKNLHIPLESLIY